MKKEELSQRYSRYYATLEDYTMDKSMNGKIKIETLSQCIDKVTKEAEKEARKSIGRIYGNKDRRGRKNKLNQCNT